MVMLLGILLRKTSLFEGIKIPLISRSESSVSVPYKWLPYRISTIIFSQFPQSQNSYNNPGKKIRKTRKNKTKFFVISRNPKTCRNHTENTNYSKQSYRTHIQLPQTHSILRKL